MEKAVLEILADCLDEELRSILETARFDGSPLYHARSHRLEMRWKVSEPLEYQNYYLLIQQLRLALHAEIDLSLEAESFEPSLGRLEPYLLWLSQTDRDLEAFKDHHPCLTAEKALGFQSFYPDIHQAMSRAAPHLKARLERLGMPVDIVCTLEDEKKIPGPTAAPPQTVQQAAPPEKSTARTWSSRKVTPVTIRDLSDGLENIQIEGRIYALELRRTKTGRSFLELYVSDDDEAILCKAFEKKNFSLDQMEALKSGDYVRLTGSVRYDSYRRSIVLLISRIEPARKPQRKDYEPQKRIEWHVHSNFSEMDGVCSVESFIQQAWDWGMPALGLCDHNVVQAFPMAQHKIEALKKKDPSRSFKMLYGCEMTMVRDTYQIVHNPSSLRLEEAEYVVFDLETTGLSSRLDEIIEFGAVKMKQGEITDRLQMFINPKRPLPVSISELTHIQQSDVDGAPVMEEVFDRLREFIGDAVLVAHNAVFDVGMLNAAARRLNKEEFSNPVIDTLQAAYSMLDLRTYKLGSVCRHYEVPYDGEGAHRADYDAQVLSSVFLYMLREWGSEATLESLSRLDASTAMRRNHSRHISVFARNAQGLKELFELVTLSHTRYLKYNPSSTNVTGQPVIPRRVLEEYHARGNLLFGSSCQNGEIFDLAHTRSEKELVEAAGFYDYLEIQPLEVYKNLLDRQLIHSVDELKSILGFILDAGKKAGVPVIASGDSHYVSRRQKRVRDIYINAKSNGNLRHPLYFRRPEERHRFSAPDQHFLTTSEMLEAFDWLDEDLRYEIVIENPEKLAQKTEELFPVKDRLYPPEMEGSDQKLRDICYQRARRQYGDPLPEPVEARLRRELDAIIGAGYYVVYYISHLLVKKSNEDGYLVGSRGSVGSSFVATMSGITEVNPLPPHYLCPHCRHLEWVTDGSVHSGFDLPERLCPECGKAMQGEGQDIPFETFLGFNGDKVPDIDLSATRYAVKSCIAQGRTDLLKSRMRETGFPEMLSLICGRHHEETHPV